MSAEKPVPDKAAVDQLIGLSWGWLVSRGIFAAAELGIADSLRDGPGRLVSWPPRLVRVRNTSIGSCGC
jgi:hypothetical protein